MEERRSKERVITIEIYTDGSSKHYGQVMRFGGWAYIVLYDSNIIHQDCNSEYGATNQRMELTAVANALEYIQKIRRPSEKVIIYSDSAYLVNCWGQKWYKKWLENGWHNSKGAPVANMELWFKLIPFFDNFWYEFRKIPGHSGVIWNERCDALAQKEAEKLKLNWRGIKNDG